MNYLTAAKYSIIKYHSHKIVHIGWISSINFENWRTIQTENCMYGYIPDKFSEACCNAVIYICFFVFKLIMNSDTLHSLICDQT